MVRVGRAAALPAFTLNPKPRDGWRIMILWEDEITEPALLESRVQAWQEEQERYERHASLLESVAFWLFMVAFVAMIAAQLLVAKHG